ncbi:MAG: SAM-dependent chlorinase/fluorinase [Elusimicrobia bacterium]|nr:SAM-dependent chlorinase/fluorinase [Elusimicrobiota bacterium]
MLRGLLLREEPARHPQAGWGALRPIVLLTDFGLQDPFVGVMKGVILGINPRARLLDLCHGIAPRDVRAAAFWLTASAGYLPEGSIVVTVVDPGVGSGRKILWARSAAREYLFPDNGVTTWLEGREPFLEVREVAESRHFLPAVSSTFHGRDIFAPVAARLSLGLRRSSLGPRAEPSVRLAPGNGGGGLGGRVVALDRFGNAVTSLRTDAVGARAAVLFKGRSLGPVRSCFGEAPAGAAMAVAGSFGFVELAVNGGDFSRRFGARPGDRVVVERAGKPSRTIAGRPCDR